MFSMKVNYKKLWKLLIDKEMKKTDLITVAGINPNILARLGKGNMFQWKVCIRFERLLIVMLVIFVR